MSFEENQPQPAPSEVASALRIIDANGNRALEGLRVVEEFLRFGRQDTFLSRTCKQLRHDVSKTLEELHVERKLACRSTTTDVGTSSQTTAEYERTSLMDVAIANSRRVAESLRALEEYSKLLDKDAAKRFESLRYQLYTLEKAVSHVCQSQLRLADSQVYVLVDLKYGFGKEFEDRLRQLSSGGVDVIQLRDKERSDREVIAAARLAMQITAGSEMKFIVNDRPDIAAAVSADGVHVGQDDLCVADARRVVGPDSLIGVSTHSIDQARQAVLDGADYIGVGPVFPSNTKHFEEFVGLELVRQVADEISIPAFAIGGISHEKLNELFTAGCSRVAVSTALWHAEDPKAATEAFRERVRTLRSVDQS